MNEQELRDLITDLARPVGPSGTEPQMQAALLDRVRDVADEVFVDVLGNGVAVKRGDGPHVLLAAHADELGVMVIHIEDNGFLRLISVGDVDPHCLPGRIVRFTNGTVGVVGAEAQVKREELGFEHLYVDIGAESGAEARERAFVGLEGVVDEPVREVAPHRLAGRALDNRAGCAIAIAAFRSAAAAGRRVSLVFTAQQELGARGARTAAYRLRPDLALVIDAAPCGDTPGAERMELKLGAGPAVKIVDATAVVPARVKDHLLDAGKRLGLAIQYEVWPRGRSDAGALQAAAGGVAVGGISYPARYMGTPAVMIDLRDVAACARLAAEAVTSYPG